ncbi:MAG: sigma-54-dependent Fis family transcriptional regulator [Desulfuromonas sp.]|nr:MAG: sigma-54-dependent Fis family transcriptional regulator [Desulfuromonas sp.]
MNRKGRIMLVDDDELIISMLGRALHKEGYETCMLFSGTKAVEKIIDWQPQLLLLDINLGDGPSGLEILESLKEEGCEFPIIMLTADDSAESAIRALKAGASDYLNKPFNIEEVKIVIEKLLVNSRIKNELDYLKKKQDADFSKPFIGESSVIRQILGNARKMAEAGVPSILVTGDSGSGKEVLARNIHHWRFGERPDYDTIPFVAVNCTALPENLIEGELFGHVKGAFTDAKSDKKGVFEMADGGTLLLDEIGDMRLDLQVKLLRVLEERTVRRLGGKVDLPVNVNVVACTNRDLRSLATDGKFREDLYYRLSSFALHLPPLRERREDVPTLARHFLGQFARKYAKQNIRAIADDAMALLSDYDWPGNVRELRNVIERCVVLENVEVLTTAHFPYELSGQRETVIGDGSNPFQIIIPDEGIALPEVEKELYRLALKKAKNNMTKAAKLLKVSYDTFRYHAKKYELV